MAKQIIVVTLVIIAFLVIGFYAVTFQARMEAKAFNRFSKTQITWFDTLWADYRILPDK